MILFSLSLYIDIADILRDQISVKIKQRVMSHARLFMHSIKKKKQKQKNSN